jgi:LytS/YehU family sensor histidine kinase
MASLAGASPALLLQPLLVNAFKHGVERSRDAVRIEVEARRDGERMHIAIRNTGSVLGPDREEGVGLRNCRERLSVLYGDAAQLQLTQLRDAVEAAVTLPWQEHRA